MKRFLGKSLFIVGLMLFAAPSALLAQQNIAYVDSEYILERVPEYQAVQQQVDRLAQEWQQELDRRQQEIDELFREYQARELLFTREERQRKREEIVQAEEQLGQQRRAYFGPEGELFKEQQNLMKPIQERVLAAVEEVASREGYDYVFDKSGEFLFMFAREQYDLNDEVLEELGIDLDSQQGGGQ